MFFLLSVRTVQDEQRRGIGGAKSEKGNEQFWINSIICPRDYRPFPGRTIRSVLLYAEIRAVISLKWPVIRPYYVTIRSSYTVAFRYTAVGNRIFTVHGRKTGHFNDVTARISA